MDRVEELETAIDGLPPEDFRRLAEWFRERDQANWDQELDADFVAGKLDFLMQEADAELESGLVRDWPSSK